MILSYNLVSVGLCLVLYRKIESEDKRLAKTLKFKVMNSGLFILVENWYKVMSYSRLPEDQETCTQLEWAWQTLL